MTGLGWVSLVLFAGVVLIWLYMLVRVLRGQGANRASERRTLVFLTLAVAALAAMRIMG